MDANSIVNISANSNVAKSCRRIFFNHLYNTNYEDGFHVDVMYGSGSGTLLFFEGKFFLLTAKHVIDKNCLGEYQNNSPFWVPVNTKPGWESLFDFLFPKYAYEIGCLITEQYQLVDNNDIILIELFDSMPLHMPDHFIDLTDESSYMRGNDYWEGQFLITNGYPFQLNNFDHDFKKGDFTHLTNIQRHSVAGICLIDNNTPYITHEKTDTGDVNPDGMSGGVVCNAWDKQDKVQWAGLILSGSNMVTRFMPAWCIVESIKNIKGAKKYVIDPAAENEPDPEAVRAILSEYARKYILSDEIL